MTTRALISGAWLGLLALWSVPALAQGERPLRGAAIQIKELRLDADARSTDVRGLALEFRYRVGRVETDKALFLVARLTDERGRRVASAVDDWSFRDRDMNLHGKTQLLTVPRYSWHRGTIFVPFYAMKLAPGPHRLSLSFEGVSDVRACKSGGQPDRIEVIGAEGAAVDLVKPPYRMVRMMVRRIEVVEKNTDAVFASRLSRPDLAWRAFFQLDLHKGKVHSSSTRDNSFRGAWNQYTEPFPFSEGDRLTLTVIDRDVMSHDLLGRFRLTLDQLTREGGLTLDGGSVTELVLGPSKVR